MRRLASGRHLNAATQDSSFRMLSLSKDNRAHLLSIPSLWSNVLSLGPRLQSPLIRASDRPPRLAPLLQSLKLRRPTWPRVDLHPHGQRSLPSQISAYR